MALAGCGPGPTGDGQGEPAPDPGAALDVHAINHPLQYFAERIGGDAVRVTLPVPADVDPALWSPGPEAIAALQAADLVLLNGAGYEPWVDRVSLRASSVVDTSGGFRDRLIAIEDAAVHSHGPQGEHSHGQVAFTVWLDPTLAIEQARAVRDALAASRPSEAAAFDERLGELENDLAALDADLRDALAGLAGDGFVGSHPVYQYLARRYGLDLPSVHFEPDEAPDERAWGELQAILAAHPARRMLWEGEPLPATAGRLRDLGVESVVFDPCANRPQDGDLMAVLRGNVERLH
jgi:zinc transport system substrate-binding protein